MMSSAEFRSLQARLSGGRGPKPKVHAHAFTGLLRCGRCGSAVTASRAKGHVYYHCTDRLHVCSKAGVREEALEAQLLERFDRLSVPYWLEPLLFEVALRHLAQEPEREEEAKAGREAALGTARKRLQALTGMRLRELLTDEEYLEGKARLQEEIEGLEERVQGIDDEAARRAKTARDVLAYAAWARQEFLDAGPAGRRVIAGRLGASLTLSGRELSVRLNPYLALLTERHDDLQALGEGPPGAGKGAGGDRPIKPRETGSRSARKPHPMDAVPGGPEWADQTPETGSESTKTASLGETVFAGRPGETTFKLSEGYEVANEVGIALADMIHELDEPFEFAR